MANEVEGVVAEIMNELFSSFESIEARSAAILQFVKDKGIATDEELAPYLQQAADASNVRWRAARLRLEHLFSSAIKSIQETAKASSEKTSEKDSAQRTQDQTAEAKSNPEPELKPKPTADKPSREDAGHIEKNDGEHHPTSTENTTKNAA